MAPLGGKPSSRNELFTSLWSLMFFFACGLSMMLGSGDEFILDLDLHGGTFSQTNWLIGL